MGYHDNPENTPGEVIPGGKFDETSQGLAGRKFASESFFPPGQDLNLQLQWNNLSILFFFIFILQGKTIYNFNIFHHAFRNESSVFSFFLEFSPK